MDEEYTIVQLMDYAIRKRGKEVADDWIAYAIACQCESGDPKAIASAVP